MRITHNKLSRKYLLNRTFNSIENDISRFQLSFNSQSTAFLLAWPVSTFPWRGRQEPTGADRISVGLARVTLEAAAWCLVPARPRLGPVTRARAELGAGSQPRLLDSAFTQHGPASTTQ